MPVIDQVSGSIDHNHFVSAGYLEPGAFGDPSITGLSPRRFIISSSRAAKPSASSEAVTASFGVDEGQRGFGGLHPTRHWLARVAIHCAKEVEWRCVGSNFDFIRPWL